MAIRADETQAAVREAMAIYEALVLNEQNFDVSTQRYKYPYAISAAEVFRIAKVKSRATLSAPYHSKLKQELDVFIKTLKQKTGKGNAAKNKIEGGRFHGNRIDQLVQTIAALQYKIIVLEQENSELREMLPAGQLSGHKHSQ